MKPPIEYRPNPRSGALYTGNEPIALTATEIIEALEFDPVTDLAQFKAKQAAHREKRKAYMRAYRAKKKAAKP